MPTGKVKFYDKERGFGFATRDDGGDVFVPKAALPTGVEELKPGMRIEFGVAAGKKGEQALSVVVLDAPPSLASARRPAEQLQVMVEDSAGPRKVDLATRDTPEVLKRALEEAAAQEAQRRATASSDDERGLFSSIKSIFRRG